MLLEDKSAVGKQNDGCFLRLHEPLTWYTCQWSSARAPGSVSLLHTCAPCPQGSCGREDFTQAAQNGLSSLWFARSALRGQRTSCLFFDFAVRSTVRSSCYTSGLPRVLRIWSHPVPVFAWQWGRKVLCLGEFILKQRGVVWGGPFGWTASSSVHTPALLPPFHHTLTEGNNSPCVWQSFFFSYWM